MSYEVCSDIYDITTGSDNIAIGQKVTPVH